MDIHAFLDWYVQATYHSSLLKDKYNKEYPIKLAVDKAINTQGRDPNSILTEIFDISERPEEDMKMLDDFYEAIHEKTEEKAGILLGKMEEKWGSLDGEVVKAMLYFYDL